MTLLAATRLLKRRCNDVATNFVAHCRGSCLITCGHNNDDNDGRRCTQALFLYGGALRAQAHAIVEAEVAAHSKLLAEEAVGERADGHAAQAPSALPDAAAALRTAAGVYACLADKLLPPLKLQLPADRPAELLASMARCMQHLCLGDAQAITAHRAWQRRTSPAVVASLYVAASDLYEQSAKVLRDNTCDYNTVSERLRRVIAMSASLSQARAYKHVGQEFSVKEQPGLGEAACVHAISLLQSCGLLAEADGAWRELLKAEMQVRGGLEKCASLRLPCKPRQTTQVRRMQHVLHPPPRAYATQSLWIAVHLPRRSIC